MDPDERGAIIITERLRLRPLRPGDAEELFALKSDPAVTGRYGQRAHASIDHTREWVAGNLKAQGRGEVLYWVLESKDGGGAIGASCLWNFNEGRTCAEVGYELRPDYWRRGLMTEALAAIVDHAFGALGFHRLEANPLANNQASIGLLLKLGFRKEGVLRERQFIDGKHVDQWYLGLLRGERTALR